MTRWLCVLLVAGLAACAGGAAGPVPIDTAHDACAHCRMIVSDARLAAQMVAPGDEPLIFDDIGCLRDHLAVHPPPPDAAVFVAEHRTGAWIEAMHATYTRTAAVDTPMGSRIVAHADPASRDADPAANNGDDLPASAILGVAAVSGDRR